ncbi:hypothetical protein NWFMUON74_43410 [Nocardia wallacei]|uniref:Uncharacterized protein n=1 Tax=Nocardia wallacei TaxID=480035 RepID=A0A7G1KRN9_9NOCA|nr:hypothetical protein NWFMUON74_43410 [Nocardia wallacei]
MAGTPGASSIGTSEPYRARIDRYAACGSVANSGAYSGTRSRSSWTGEPWCETGSAAGRFDERGTVNYGSDTVRIARGGRSVGT